MISKRSFSVVLPILLVTIAYAAPAVAQYQAEFRYQPQDANIGAVIRGPIINPGAPIHLFGPISVEVGSSATGPIEGAIVQVSLWRNGNRQRLLGDSEVTTDLDGRATFEDLGVPIQGAGYSLRAYVSITAQGPRFWVPETAPFDVPSRAEGEYAIDVAGGYDHTLAMKADGTMWAWGGNSLGQLGSGTTEDQVTPVKVGSDSDWAVVGAGYHFSVALKMDGSLWAWGDNGSGQLGIGSTINSSIPTRVGTDSDWNRFTVGQSHVLAVKNNGTLWAWGMNLFGILGDGTSTNRSSPVRIGTDADWVQVSAGQVHSAALKRDGSLWTWGFNSAGQLGQGYGVNGLDVPTRLGTDSDWALIESGSTHMLALRSDRSLWSWGDNMMGQLGQLGTQDSLTPREVDASEVTGSWANVSGGAWHSMGTTSWAGEAYTWGSNNSVQLGYLTIDDHVEQPFSTGQDSVLVEAGDNHSLSIDRFGCVWAWGHNNRGQVGDGSTTNRQYATRIIEVCPIDTDGDFILDKDDNCPFVPNFLQEDNDNDGQGDVCDDDDDNDGVLDIDDNCPLNVNGKQNNWDGDHFGNTCDLCPTTATFGSLQSDDDNDGVGDLCDNCRWTYNPWQYVPEDTDGDGITDRFSVHDSYNTWLTQPTPDGEFIHTQPDWDGDGAGDACDCNDNYMGPHEVGADCEHARGTAAYGLDGECAASCDVWIPKIVVGPVSVPASSKPCIPLLYNGNPRDKINVVVTGNRYDYVLGSGDNRYLNPLFRERAMEAIQHSFAIHPQIAPDLDRFNFFYVDRYGGRVSYDDHDNDPSTWPECDWVFPKRWKDDCPFANIGVILHEDFCRDYASGEKFSSQATTPLIFLHEAGHAVFGLGDEYDDSPGCDTGYHTSGPFRNIWISQDDCKDNSLNPNQCWNFTPCKRRFSTTSGRWMADPALDIMSCCDVWSQDICYYGEDCKRQIDHILSRYSSGKSGLAAGGPVPATKEGEPPSKAFVHHIRSLEGVLVLDETAIVYGPTAKHPTEFAGFQVNIFSESGSLIDTHSIMDPSELRYMDPGEGFERDISFEIVVPFGDRPREFEIVKKSTGELSLKHDLRDAIADFCSQFVEITDPQCLEYAAENPPTAIVGGPYSVPEGSSVILDGSASHDASGSAASLVYTWELDDDGLYDDGSAATAGFSAAAISGPAARIVRLRTVDGEGLSDIDSTTVHIANVPPDAVCADVTTVADSVTCQAPADVDGGSADPTGLDTVELEQDPQGPYVAGQTPVTLTVTDSSGGSDTCTAMVTVADQTAPLITLNGAPNMWIKPGMAYSEPGAASVDACEGELEVSISGDVVDPHKPGIYVVTYDSQDTIGNAAVQATRTVTVSSTEVFKDGFETGDTINW